MDFTNRGGQQPQAPRPSANAAPSSSATNGNMSMPGNGDTHDHGFKNDRPKHFDAGDSKWVRIATVVLLFAITLLAIGISVLFHYGTPNEAKYVDTTKYQSVFLTNNQVYFGKIKTINNKFIDLQKVYYLNSSNSSNGTQNATTTSTSNSFSLVKLGCELHGPTDEMLINRDQVTFWENLKSTGQVSQAIAKWIQQNPNGQTTCSTSTGSTQQSTSSTSSTSTSTKQ